MSDTIGSYQGVVIKLNQRHNPNWIFILKLTLFAKRFIMSDYTIDQVTLNITNFLREIKPTTSRRPIPYHYTMSVARQDVLDYLLSKEINLELSQLDEILNSMDNLLKLPLDDSAEFNFFPARLRR